MSGHRPPPLGLKPPLSIPIGPKASVDGESTEFNVTNDYVITKSGVVKGGEKKRYSYNNFTVVSVLGKGQFGTVDLVKVKDSGKLFAKKVIPIPVDAVQKEQLRREIDTMKEVKSAYCVRMYGAYISESRLNIIMEYMDRGTLSDLLKAARGKVETSEEVVKCIAYEMFKGLYYLHTLKGIIHRDIKPLNILASSEGILKISDFGLASKLEGTLKIAATFVGTMIYMSPERLNGIEYTMTSDVWSLGLVIEECLLGRYPLISEEQLTNPSRGGFFFTVLQEVSKADPTEQLKGLDISEECKDLLRKTLARDYKVRITSEEALKHPWFDSVRGQGKERRRIIKEWIDSIPTTKADPASLL